MKRHLRILASLGLGLGLSFGPCLFSAALPFETGRAWAKRIRGAVIVEETKSEGKNRFRSLRDWDKTIQAYRAVYRDDRNVAWRTVETPSKVKAIYIENLRRNQGWDGINVYEADGKVMIYVVPSDPEPRSTKQTQKTAKKGS